MNFAETPTCMARTEPEAGPTWELRPACGDFHTLAKELKIHPVTARLLASRGFGTSALARRFLDPGWNDLLDPSGLPDFERAMDRTAKAIAQQERIVIVGDYDVDGIMATAILFTALRIAGGNVRWTIPNRLVDGYGLGLKHVATAHQQGATLVITADCGIRSLDAIQYAGSCGIDVIVTDHHMPGADLPPAIAVINPNRVDATYGNRHLCGAGLAFQFAAGLLRQVRMPQGRAGELLGSFLKLAAIATIADVMPLVGENRAMVWLGLQGLAEVRSPGLRLLLESARLAGGITPTAREIGFRVAPRINAAGRMEDASLVMRLLTTRDPAEARQLVDGLEEINRRRKEEQARVLDEIVAGRFADDARVLVFSGYGWHRGVLGIVAARLVEQFHRPVIVLSEEEDGFAYGSGRSVPGIDLNTLLQQVRGYLETFGGHAQAVGLSLRVEDIGNFRDAICCACPPSVADATVQVDCNLRLAEATQVWPELTSLEPFGNGNPTPVFATRAMVEAPPVSISPWVSRMRVRQGDRAYDIKIFGGSTPSVHPGQRIDLAYSLQCDRWRREGFGIIFEALRQAR